MHTEGQNNNIYCCVWDLYNCVALCNRLDKQLLFLLLLGIALAALCCAKIDVPCMRVTVNIVL